MTNTFSDMRLVTTRWRGGNDSFTLSPGTERRFPGLSGGVPRYLFAIHNLADSDFSGKASVDVVQVCDSSGGVQATILPYTAEIYPISDDVVLKAPSANAAAITLNVSELEQGSSVSVAGAIVSSYGIASAPASEGAAAAASGGAGLAGGGDSSPSRPFHPSKSGSARYTP